MCDERGAGQPVMTWRLADPQKAELMKSTEMVRRGRLRKGGWKCIPIANFGARIVRDILWDDGAGEQR